MKLPEDQEEKKQVSPSIILTVAAVTAFVGCLFILVFFWNKKSDNPDDKKTETGIAAANYEPTVADLTDLLTGSTLSPDDLDFWDQYPQESSKEDQDGSIGKEGNKESSLEGSKKGTNEGNKDGTKDDAKKGAKEEAKVAANDETDPSKDGKHTLLIDADGKEEWVLISPYLPKHNYDFTKLVCQSDKMKYFYDGKQVSYLGVDVSKLQDYVDFTKVKKAGVDYVMVRVGARGYSSGQLVIDEYFTENVKRANDAELKVGVYFTSQAVNTAEAEEEADLVLANIKDLNISYPVAFYMGNAGGEQQRTDSLLKADRTAIVRTFLDKIKNAGYVPILYATKEQMIKKLDLSKLTDYDIWLSQISDIPDFPYRFTMWQYSVSGNIDGIAGHANMNISFVDFSEK